MLVVVALATLKGLTVTFRLSSVTLPSKNRIVCSLLVLELART